MSHFYRIRNYSHQSDDRSKLANLLSEVDDITSQHYFSPHTLLESIEKRPRYDPEKYLFVLERTGKIIGFINVIPELIIKRVIFLCLVHVGFRRRGFGRQLVNCAIQCAHDLNIKSVQTTIFNENSAAQHFLSKLSFQCIRVYNELRRDLTSIPSLKRDSSLSYIHFKQGEEEMLTQLQNRSFEDTWGYNPNTVEDILYQTRNQRFSRKNIIIVYKKSAPVGYCWLQINNKEKVKEEKESTGRIHMLGVDPDHRGEEIGKLILTTGMQHLKQRGINLVELTVDNENKPAKRLYESLGFKVWKTRLWYEKQLD